jgi:chitin synthase
MVWNEMAGIYARADASIPNFTDPWPVKDVSNLLQTIDCSY